MSPETVGGEGARSLTADGVAAIVGGELIGDPSVRVSRVAPLDRAGDDALSFLASAKYESMFASSAAAVVLVGPEQRDAAGAARARIVVDRPHDAMLRVLPHLYAAPTRESGIDATARIGRGARIGERVRIDAGAVIGAGASLGNGCWIGANAVVGDGVVLGDDTQIYPGATLYAGAELGRRVTIHAGARIASDGFGYVFRDGAHAKIPHVGRCLIGDDVEIGANTTIDRGSIDDTVIGAGTKIDNLVHVGHNVRIGRLCLLMAQVGIAGSARIGDGVVIAGQAGLGGHINVGDRARIGGQSGVFGDVPAGETWSGYPARPHREALRTQGALWKLAGAWRQIERVLARESGA